MTLLWWSRGYHPNTTLLRLINLVSCLRDGMPFLNFCQNKQLERKPLLVQKCEKFMGNINIHDIHSRHEDGNIPHSSSYFLRRCTWLPLHLKAVKNHRCVCVCAHHPISAAQGQILRLVWHMPPLSTSEKQAEGSNRDKLLHGLQRLPCDSGTGSFNAIGSRME